MERIKLYRRLDNIEKESQLEEFEKNLVDRFGEIPEQTLGLFEVVRLRWLAIDLGMAKIVFKGNKMICFFVSDGKSAYYESPVFTRVLNFVQQKHKICEMKQENTKLRLSFRFMKDVFKARELLSKI